MLTNVSGDNRISSSNLVELVDNLLHSQAALLAVGKRVFLPPTFDFIEPWLGIEAGDALVDLSQGSLGVTNDFDIWANHFVHL